MNKKSSKTIPNRNLTSTQINSSKDRQNWTLEKNDTSFFIDMFKNKKSEYRPHVLWGWKRDLIVNKKQYPESRTVYFSADLSLNKNHLSIGRVYFFLETRANNKDIDLIKKDIGTKRKLGDYNMKVSVWNDKKYPSYSRLRIEIGNATEYDNKTIERRLKGKPRFSISPPKIASEHKDYNILDYKPFAVCCGSGLSSESGLPLLGEIHNLFEVDNRETGQLIFGKDDKLPYRLVKNVDEEFKKFCQFSVDAIKAKPSKSHYVIADLYKKGIVKQVFTDNMDDLLVKLNIPYIQTRLSIFPDKFPVKFDPKVKSLLVIGVAVDRRQVIKQARAKGLKIIVVNPVMGVAPHSRNMDYMRNDDIFFKETADDFFSKFVSAAGLSKK